MNLKELFDRRLQGLLALLVWAVVALLLMQKGPFGLDEGGAKALLLDWSIADHVANSVVTLGTPDTRALLWIPLGFLLPGQVIAAKAVLAALTAATAYGLYRWCDAVLGEETALVATGLWLLSPLTLHQIDSLSAANLLIGLFVAGYWLDRVYRDQPVAFGAFFFAQLFACAFAASFHPAGLAYPLALAWRWKTAPADQKHQKYFLAGLAFLTLMTLIMLMGWHGLSFFTNPLRAASSFFNSLWDPDQSLSGQDVAEGALGLLAVLFFLIRDRRSMGTDLMGTTLWLAALLGAIAADGTWATVILVLLLYRGAAWLFAVRKPRPGDGFWKQRGWILILLFGMLTASLRADRLWFDSHRLGMLSDQDMVIKTLAENVEDLRQTLEKNNQPMPRIRVASQWPARTMIACRCDALPLPPVARDPQHQLSMLRGLTHLVMQPKAPANLGLTQNLAVLGTEVETFSLMPGGVILRIRKPDLAPALPQPQVEEPPPPLPDDSKK